ncbi:Rid family hydrolase [Haloarcula onubensis]|uniref:Rid family hydrolase n=1 Tax=Haloarcula onubensis TaxID=2950539 RepID=A0ABU2FNU4_9EURY|nr:Rid family hydrolase [Halomicroarcula sp. S3CR25-11]MDS0282432.1 Rid family hydrolase [Halomicroarcula sp. S3CR25-11]
MQDTVFRDDIDDFDATTDVFGDPPARSAVGVDALPKSVAVEIDATALR